MADNVTAFPGRSELPDNPIDPGPHVVRCCAHASIALDDHTRSVRCAQCGATLDPFDFLRQNARVLQRAWDNHRIVSQQATETAARVSALKREEQNLKARVKRAQAASGAIVHVRGS